MYESKLDPSRDEVRITAPYANEGETFYESGSVANAWLQSHDLESREQLVTLAKDRLAYDLEQRFFAYYQLPEEKRQRAHRAGKRDINFEPSNIDWESHQKQQKPVRKKIDGLDWLNKRVDEITILARF
jgi:hypothetical protein